MAQYWRRLAIRESTKGLKLVESEMLHHDAHVTQHDNSQICASEIATRSLTVLQCDIDDVLFGQRYLRAMSDPEQPGSKQVVASSHHYYDSTA